MVTYTRYGADEAWFCLWTLFPGLRLDISLQGSTKLPFSLRLTQRMMFVQFMKVGMADHTSCTFNTVGYSANKIMWGRRRETVDEDPHAYEWLDQQWWQCCLLSD